MTDPLDDTPPDDPYETDTITLPGRSHTDDGNALRLVDQHQASIRYCPQRGKWLTWDDYRWTWDDNGHVPELARHVIRTLPAADEASAKHRHRSLGARALRSMVDLARTDPRIVVPVDQLDADPYALCTPEGVWNLRTATGIRKANTRDQLHTRATAVAPDPEQPTPRWTAFLEQTFAGDQALIGYVQRLAGYSATGAVTHHVLPFLFGAGQNGKSVFLDVLRGILGDYAATAPLSFLMAGQTQHETEIARLHGLRFIVCSEVNQEQRFDEAKVKLLTGGDALTARFMHKDHFTFVPTHHLWLMGNHQPEVRSGGGESFFRRMRLIPFTQRVPDEQKVEGLAQQLIRDEGAGILAWVCAGAAQATARGLQEPGQVLAATHTYQEEEDAFGRFVDEALIVGGGQHVRIDTRQVVDAYKAWCKTEGMDALNSTKFGRELRIRTGTTLTRSHGRKFYTGLTLAGVEEPTDRPDDPFLEPPDPLDEEVRPPRDEGIW